MQNEGMTRMSSALITALIVVSPVMCLIIAGVLFKRVGLMNDAFVEGGSKLIYNVSLPALLFNAIYTADFATAANPDLIMASVVGTLVFVIMAMGLVHFMIPERTDRGVIIQGAYRSNIGIVGLALSANAYPEFFATASVFMACTTLVYNLLAVMLLNFYSDKHHSIKDNILALLKNPIIISIVLALLASYFHLSLPRIAEVSLAYFAQLTLPLALLCTGASLQFFAMRKAVGSMIIANVGKCMLYPAVILSIGYYLELDSVQMGIVFLMSASPTAAASYIMAKKTNSNPVLAANIVVSTTVVAIPIMMLAMVILIQYGIIAPANLPSS